MKGEYPSPATFQIAAREAHGLAAETYDALGEEATRVLQYALASTAVPVGCDAVVEQRLRDAGCVKGEQPFSSSSVTFWGQFVLSTGGAR